MPRQLGGHLFDCSLADMIARDVFFSGCYAAQELAFLRGTLQLGMTFVDVGAHWGLFSLAAAGLVGDTGRVVALEPNPEAFLKLEFNLRRNNVINTTAFQLAAADREGDLRLTRSSSGIGTWDFSRPVSDEPVADTIQVESKPLDDVLKELGIESVDLLKIDVEGGEDLVLRGMEAGLKEQVYDRILLEIHPVHLAARLKGTEDILNELIGKGYEGCGLNYSPKAYRRAFYDPWRDFTDFLTPLTDVEADANPHTVWLSPKISYAPRGCFIGSRREGF